MKMTKRVNINAPIAIRNIKPPIYGRCNGIVMSTGDILKCLCKRAIVDEVLPDGSTVRLNMKNYYTDNGAGLDASVSNVIKSQPQPEAAKPTDNIADTCQISDDKNQDEATKETENIPDEDADIKAESAPEEAVSPKDNVPDSNDTAAATTEKTEQSSEDADIKIESAPEETASPKDTTVATEEPKNSTKAKQPANRQKTSKKKTSSASKTAK